MDDWTTYVERLGSAARRAAGQLATVRGDVKTRVLGEIARSIRASRGALLEANAADVAAAQKAELAPALVERLRLTDKRIDAMADGVSQIAGQVDPAGQVIEGYVRP